MIGRQRNEGPRVGLQTDPLPAAARSGVASIEAVQQIDMI
jgi:hypothetical protein